MPVGVLAAAAAAAGTKGDKGRLLGAAGDGGLFLGFGVLMSREEMAAGVKYKQERAQEMRFHSSEQKGNNVPGALHKDHN